MFITSEAQALEILDDTGQDMRHREAAARYLAAHPSPEIVGRLVQALQDNDFGVRWEAAVALSQLGNPALIEMLKALTDPKRVGDSRLRRGIYHALHYNQSLHLPVSMTRLMEALKGPAADIASMEEAGRLLQLIEHDSEKSAHSNNEALTHERSNP